MPDAGFVLPPSFRIATDAFAPVAGGSITFYAAGTTTPQTVYSDATLSTSLGSVVYLDSGGHTVASSGSATKVTVYTGSALIKMVVKDSTGVTLATYDSVQCAQDTSALSAASSGSGISGVLSRTDNFSVTSDHDGKWIDCDPTGGAFTVTFPSAATVGDGFAFGLRHAGTTTTNAVKYTTVSSETVAYEGATSTADALTGGGEAVWFVSNGAGWRIITRMAPRLSHPMPVQVVDRLSAAPSSPEPGAFYIVTGTPTGWPTGTAAHDLMRSNGQGGWITYRPTSDCGWLAFVQDENLNYQFQGTAWVALSNITAPTSSALKIVVARDVKASGTAGGDTTSGSWLKHTLNTSSTNTITGATVDTSGSQITLPTGSYLVYFAFACHNSGGVTGRIQSTTTATVVQGDQVSTGSATSDHVIGSGVVTVTAATEIFELQYNCTVSKATTGLGIANSIASTSEIYATVTIIDLASLQGPQGETGPQGSVAAMPAGTLTLANGGNANVVVGTNVKHRISGPTGAFSISGFVAPASNGAMLVVYNPTAQTMTLTNDATSTTTNRILTMTGADVALTGPSMATLTYDSTDARWILTSTQG